MAEPSLRRGATSSARWPSAAKRSRVRGNASPASDSMSWMWIVRRSSIAVPLTVSALAANGVFEIGRSPECASV